VGGNGKELEKYREYFLLVFLPPSMFYFLKRDKKGGV